jgi:hypothetical protein
MLQSQPKTSRLAEQWHTNAARLPGHERWWKPAAEQGFAGKTPAELASLMMLFGCLALIRTNTQPCCLMHFIS